MLTTRWEGPKRIARGAIRSPRPTLGPSTLPIEATIGANRCPRDAVRLPARARGSRGRSDAAELCRDPSARASRRCGRLWIQAATCTSHASRHLNGSRNVSAATCCRLRPHRTVAVALAADSCIVPSTTRMNHSPALLGSFPREGSVFSEHVVRFHRLVGWRHVTCRLTLENALPASCSQR
jgi:hypothetical protein